MSIIPRRILIGTPIKHTGVNSTYLNGLVPVLSRRFEGLELEVALLEGTCVTFARNELVHYAKEKKCQELVFVDSDAGFELHHFERLISHVDLDVVGGLYCKRKPGAPSWNVNLKEGCEVDPMTGLCEVEDIGTGFMKIRLDTVLPKLEKAYPFLQFGIHEKGQNPGTAWEYFRLGCEGPRTPESRLERIKNIVRNLITESPTSALDAINHACFDEQPPSVLRGEDFFFCKMVRSVGLKVYADFGMAPVPHIGEIGFPITPDMVGLDNRGNLMAAKTK